MLLLSVYLKMAFSVRKVKNIHEPLVFIFNPVVARDKPAREIYFQNTHQRSHLLHSICHFTYSVS